MSAVLEEPSFVAALYTAQDAAKAAGLPFAGTIAPQDAWQLFSTGRAVLVDVRSAEERKFVGHVPESLHVAWASGTSLTRNPRFVRELEAKVKKRMSSCCCAAAASARRSPPKRRPRPASPRYST